MYLTGFWKPIPLKELLIVLFVYINDDNGYNIVYQFQLSCVFF